MSLYHVHRPRHAATSFNPHADAVDSWRFSPFPDNDGHPVPSWYGALAPAGALCETVFRDVVMSRHPSIDRATVLADRVISRVTLDAPVQLVKLFGNGLIRLLLKTSFTTSEPRSYPKSRRIAQALYEQFPETQGFIWHSRINNEEVSLVLYERRMPGSFATTRETHPLDKGKGLIMVMEVASSIGCTV